MIHVRAVKMPGGNLRGPLPGFYTSSGFGPPNIKEQLRRGVLLAAVASVLIVVGSMLTWLVYTEVFGSKVPIMGPLVMALGVLLVVLSIRQFCIVWKLKQTATPVPKPEAGQAEEEEMPYGSMLEMDTWDTGQGGKSPYHQCSQQNHIYEQPQPQAPGFVLNTCSTIPSYTHITAVAPNSHAEVNTTQSLPVSQSTTATVTPVESTADGKIRSCCDLKSMAKVGSMEAPNPRPVICYSQSQLQLLDREVSATASERTSPTLMSQAPSQKSLGEHSASPQEYISHRSVIERTDVVETI